MRFNANTTLVNVLDGKRYCIVSYNASLGPADGFKESYTLMEIATGLQIQVVGNAINFYEDEEALPQGWFPPGQHNYKLPGPGIHHIDIKISVGDITVSACDHEFVTWTGLRGEVTDCTKCKAIK